MPDEIAQLLSDGSPDVRSTCRSLRALVKEVMPEAVEFVYHGAVSYSLSESPSDRICYIAPYGRHANLVFSFGAHLSDPRGLLEGEGLRMRHVKLRSVEAVRDPALADLLRAAWADAPYSIGRLRQRARKRRADPTPRTIRASSGRSSARRARQIVGLRALPPGSESGRRG